VCVGRALALCCKKPVTRLTLALMALSFPGAAQTFSTLYSFAGGSNAAYPDAGVIVDTNGNLFGTTAAGGAGSFGAIYELSPGAGGAWAEKLLYSFLGGSDGALPDASLVLGPGNVLYGTTFAGGTTGNGTVFQLSPPANPGDAWTKTVLYSFQGGSDGSGPKTAATLGPSGTLFGTTFAGGATGAGTVFQLTPPAGGAGDWSERIIYSFLGGADGQGPESGVILERGRLYGATCCGSEGGTVFQLRPAKSGTWTKISVFSFSARSTGDTPAGNLAIDRNGVLYGVTVLGGASGYGTVFGLAPQGTGQPYILTTIHDFTNGGDGGSPDSGVVHAANGTLYVPVTSGCEYGAGGVLQFTPDGSGGWNESVLYSFGGAADGSQPQGIVLDRTNAIYGTTGFDGAAGYGTVYELLLP